MLTTMLLALAGAPLDREVRAAPPRVRAFIERRAECNHFAGEEAYDAERAADIERAWTRLRCETLAVDERRLRAHYRRSPRLLALLRRSEDMLGE